MISSRKAIVCVVALFCLSLASLSAPAQISDDERWATGEYEAWFLSYQRYSKTDAVEAQKKWKHIQAETEQSPANEWAGNYALVCDMCEVSLNVLRWSKEAGFVEVYVYTCLPELRGLNLGSLIETPAMLQFIPEYPTGSGRKQQPVTNYLKVKWGERHYLIAENKIAEFCDLIAGVNVSDENQKTMVKGVYLKSSDAEKPIEGLPVLPEGYEQFLKQPIDAKITGIGKSYVAFETEYGCWKREVIPVTLNAGSKSGVKVGMTFNSSDESVPGQFEITSVGKNSSRAVFEPYDSEPCEPSEATPEDSEEQEPVEHTIKIGLKLSTRPEMP